MDAKPHLLIGAEVSYYSAKVRSYLRYKRIPFVEVPASREAYRDVILPRTGVRFIPVLISSDDIAVQDSRAIVDFLEERYPEPNIEPPGTTQQLVASLFELYADEWLLLPAMHYRWNVPENRSFAIREFGRLSLPEATPAEQLAVGEKLSVPFAGALPVLGVHPATVSAIEESYGAFLTELDAHLAHHPRILGARPSIADFALFGPLYAHLYRDPASGRLMRERAPRVAQWVESLLTDDTAHGDFLDGDQVPATLEPLLSRLFVEFGPVLASTIDRLTAFDPGDAEAPLPRALGTHSFQLGDATAERAVLPFNVWRWQRVRDRYLALSGAARAAADELIDRIGARQLFEKPLSRRLVRVDNRLRFAPR
ncbi:MAG TPA: glutathione S-transferase [Polyangiaceae bacterium]|nr:glutathione S-transferase [Polyangiaceae bacterium]